MIEVTDTRDLHQQLRGCAGAEDADSTLAFDSEDLFTGGYLFPIDCKRTSTRRNFHTLVALTGSGTYIKALHERCALPTGRWLTCLEN
jgi:hypothetical protein